MLQLVLGRAGTGKTNYVFDRIACAANDEKKCILLVPEQSSFESEKQLYRRLGGKASLLTEALSFTRLCDLIFREYGGLAGVHLEDTGKLLLMSSALTEVSGELKIYQKGITNEAFAAVMCDTVSELKSAGATSEQLRVAAQQAVPDSGFAEKLFDISMIYDAYQAMIERGYDDPDDHLLRACKRLEGNAFFSGCEIFVDGFMAFMGGEWLLLEAILNAGCLLTVSLPCENLAQADQVSAFTSASKTANRLVEMAKRAGSKVAVPVVLRESLRYTAGALAHLAQEYGVPGAQPYAEQQSALFLTSCEDYHDELERVAAQIGELVRQGYRYREIAVIARSLERYLPSLQTVFGRYEIPFFTDLRTDIEVHPLINAVLCALEAVRGGFETGQLLSLSKSMALGMDAETAGLLENYCFIWNVEGNSWTKEFVNHPEGMAEGLSEQQALILKQINEAREDLIQPLMRLKSALRDCDGEQFARSIFEFLMDIDATEHLRQAAEQMEAGQSKAFLEMSTQVWDALMGLLDVFGGAHAKVRQPLGRMLELLRMGIASIQLGALPQTIDQVLVGTADRIRPNAPRTVFVIGLNEGEFPLWNAVSGILSVSERELLRTQGIDLLRTADQQAIFEKYYVYFALTQASDQLYLSWPQRNTAGTGLAVSAVVEQVEKMYELKFSSLSSQNEIIKIHNENTALDLMACLWQRTDSISTALRAHFAICGPNRIEELERLSAGERYLLHEEGVQALFAGHLHLSPSRIERYQTCPFSYFCQSGLRLQARRRAEFSPLESGTLIHFVLEQMLKTHGAGLAALARPTMQEQVQALVLEHLAARVTDLAGMPERFKYLFRRLVGQLVRLLERLGKELSQSEFIPVAFELPVGKEVPPLTLRTSTGETVTVEGVVDRVDEMVKNGKRYLRVIDYKSGQKEFRLADVCNGLNLQMLIYLFALCDYQTGTAVENLPAGVLYMPARDKVVSAGRMESDELVDKQRVKLWKMSGLLLDDFTALTGMERELRGVYIPVKQAKDGSIDLRYSSVATAAQMGAIRRNVETSIIRLAENLKEGRVAACPVEGASEHSPCEWCDYYAVCGHEPEDENRAFAKLDRAAAMKLLEEEAQNLNQGSSD